MEVHYLIERSKVREFAIAVRDDHCDGDMIPVPPTFPIVFTTPFLEKMIVDVLHLDRRRVLHGEQEYEYFRPLRIGDRVLARSRIVEDFQKKGQRGGQMRFIITETDILNEETGELIARERVTTIETTMSPTSDNA